MENTLNLIRLWCGDCDLDYHLVGLVPSTQLHTQPVEAAGDEP